ncbi:hypothetical protein [Saccharospirillum salsuginis]|uniref:Uncharacterized protein n=1 Tax=Saccharospirillum salsuginis TaxID=418750 RepID=A0A918K6Q3_9GAMM|nr:hypothetical protein [Saccharospirillum salsuginis]GGX52378.1 hypothetical protein GCM10007392_19640 [Saccharospirillum salsuginis]
MMKTPSLSATLLTNIVTSAIAGIVLISAPGVIGQFMGGVAPWLLRLVGAGLVLFALGVYGVRRNLPAANTGVAWVLALDLAWIAATPVVMVVYAQALSLWGHLLLADVALLVSVFAGLEWYWLKRLKGTAVA